MALSHRRTVAILFYGNTRICRDGSYGKDYLKRIANVQRDLSQVCAGVLLVHIPIVWHARLGTLQDIFDENDLTNAMMDDDCRWFKGPG